MIVYNAETFGYSDAAILNWTHKGYEYQAGSWEEIKIKNSFKKVEILIVRLARKVDKLVLDKFPELKAVVTATTGTDHIDLVELKRKKIKLFCLKEHRKFLDTIPSTAEHSWALLLSLIRNIPSANENVKCGVWDRDQFRGYQLQNKKIGIVGLGRTGKKVAKYATAFDMKVQYFDPYVEDSRYIRYKNLNELLQNSEIISLHIHLTEETFKIINQENVSYLNDKCFLVNTSRGNIWDEETMAAGLLSGKIAGIATDVICSELNSLKNSSLWKLQNSGYNIIITPHIGGATWDAMSESEVFLSKNVNFL